MTKIDDDQNFYRWLKYNIEPFLISTVEMFKMFTAYKGTKILLKQLTITSEKNNKKQTDKSKT